MIAPTGPWTNQGAAFRRWREFIEIPNIDGKKPVAVERRDGEVRLLYVKPSEDREPSAACHLIREYVWDGK